MHSKEDIIRDSMLRLNNKPWTAIASPWYLMIFSATKGEISDGEKGNRIHGWGGKARPWQRPLARIKSPWTSKKKAASIRRARQTDTIISLAYFRVSFPNAQAPKVFFYSNIFSQEMKWTSSLTLTWYKNSMLSQRFTCSIWWIVKRACIMLQSQHCRNSILPNQTEDEEVAVNQDVDTAHLL